MYLLNLKQYQSLYIKLVCYPQYFWFAIEFGISLFSKQLSKHTFKKQIYLQEKFNYGQEMFKQFFILIAQSLGVY